ncbi:MAG: ABC transporter permease [Candidatus Solibacter usitatus]|nr:ABC transporter permease [Candidatus Solibacter usitatus]
MSDLRYAFRTLSKTPAVSAVVILSLALGIGANTAAYSMFDQMLLRMMPVPDPQQLVAFYHPGPVQGRASSDDRDMPAFTYSMFRHFQRQQPESLSGVIGSRIFPGSLSFENTPAPGEYCLVSGNYFEVLGVRAALGRVLEQSDETTPGGNPVVVLSHGYWTRAMGARTDVLNKTMVLNGQLVTIVGVAAAGFRGDTGGRPPELFIPITMTQLVAPGEGSLDDARFYWINVIGRMKPGVKLEQAASQLQVPYKAMLEDGEKLLVQPSHDFLRRFRMKRIVLKEAGSGRGGTRGAREPLMLLLAITALVLLIACANAANLMLARGIARQREIAVRLSIGAGRLRLIRQLLVESLVVSVLGGLAGLLAAQWTLDAVLAMLPAEAMTVMRAELDTRALAYTMGVALVCGILFGLYPALQATRPGVNPTLKDTGGVSDGSKSAKIFRNGLVMVQVALSLLLMITSGLFVTSLFKLTKVELGIAAVDQIVAVTVRPRLLGYKEARLTAFHDALENRFRSLPGVTNASVSSVSILAGDNYRSDIRVDGFVPKDAGPVRSYFSAISPGFFATMGVPLVSGRDFLPSDAEGASKVAVVNETFVKTFFEHGDALGRRMSNENRGPLNITIVGIVKDSKYSAVRNEPRPVAFLPYRQAADMSGSMTYYLRTREGAASLAQKTRAEVSAVDANVPVAGLKTLRKQVDDSMFHERAISVFSSTFAFLATIMSAIGLYGVLAFALARRTREIGIRMALGARPADVRRLVFRDLTILGGGGAAIGLSIALAAGRQLEAQLYEVKGTDPLVLGVATVVVILAVFLAGLLPLRRASHVDPMVVLRYE